MVEGQGTQCPTLVSSGERRPQDPVLALRSQVNLSKIQYQNSGRANSIHCSVVPAFWLLCVMLLQTAVYQIFVCTTFFKVLDYMLKHRAVQSTVPVHLIPMAISAHFLMWPPISIDHIGRIPFPHNLQSCVTACLFIYGYSTGRE